MIVIECINVSISEWMNGKIIIRSFSIKIVMNFQFHTYAFFSRFKNWLMFVFNFFRIRHRRLHGEANSNEEKPFCKNSREYEGCEGESEPAWLTWRSRGPRSKTNRELCPARIENPIVPLKFSFYFGHSAFISLILWFSNFVFFFFFFQFVFIIVSFSCLHFFLRRLLLLPGEKISIRYCVIYPYEIRKEQYFLR